MVYRRAAGAASIRPHGHVLPFRLAVPFASHTGRRFGNDRVGRLRKTAPSGALLPSWQSVVARATSGGVSAARSKPRPVLNCGQDDPTVRRRPARRTVGSGVYRKSASKLDSSDCRHAKGSRWPISGFSGYRSESVRCGSYACLAQSGLSALAVGPRSPCGGSPRSGFDTLLDLDHQVVDDREHPSDAVCLQSGDAPFSWAAHPALERHIPAPNDDVNRWYWMDGVTAQPRLAVDCPKDGSPNAVVVGRDGQHFDLVDDPGHSRDPLDYALGS